MPCPLLFYLPNNILKNETSISTICSNREGEPWFSFPGIEVGVAVIGGTAGVLVGVGVGVAVTSVPVGVTETLTSGVFTGTGR